MLSAASEQLARPDAKIMVTDWKALVEHGFEDIDPQGFYTGKRPRLEGA
ncbi:hypothetical protein ID068_34850 [Pseudomonas aeruginosa]|nr:hypothetical protein [Pseudomonas aeruginosa]